MIKKNYIAIARTRRLLALKSLQMRKGEGEGWHEWANVSRSTDVGNLSPQQLLAYLVEQRAEAGTK